MGSYRNNTKICVRMEIISFDGIVLLIAHVTWLLMTEVQEIRSSFGLEFTFMSDFGTLEMCSYGSWCDSPLPIR